jgi:hypothetical protein
MHRRVNDLLFGRLVDTHFFDDLALAGDYWGCDWADCWAGGIIQI